MVNRYQMQPRAWALFSRRHIASALEKCKNNWGDPGGGQGETSVNGDGNNQVKLAVIAPVKGQQPARAKEHPRITIQTSNITRAVQCMMGQISPAQNRANKNLRGLWQTGQESMSSLGERALMRERHSRQKVCRHDSSFGVLKALSYAQRQKVHAGIF